jgi:hypothetical protein
MKSKQEKKEVEPPSPVHYPANIDAVESSKPWGQFLQSLSTHNHEFRPHLSAYEQSAYQICKRVIIRYCAMKMKCPICDYSFAHQLAHFDHHNLPATAAHPHPDALQIIVQHLSKGSVCVLPTVPIHTKQSKYLTSPFHVILYRILDDIASLYLKDPSYRNPPHIRNSPIDDCSVVWFPKTFASIFNRWQPVLKIPSNKQPVNSAIKICPYCIHPPTSPPASPNTS